MPHGLLHGVAASLAAIQEPHHQDQVGSLADFLHPIRVKRVSIATAFWAGDELKSDDITPAHRGWQGSYPEEDDKNYDDESVTVEFPRPKGKDSPEWLGAVEDSEFLEETDLYQEEFVGTPQPTRKHLRPGEFPKCEEFLTGKYSPWWHPRFVFKVPVHAVRIRLTDMNVHTPKDERKPFYDAIFAGRPGNAYTINNDAVPAGGKQPQFIPFCPPLKASARYELRLTEAKDKAFDEKLTLVPQAALSRERLKWKMSSKKPKMALTTKKHTMEGAVPYDIPVARTQGEDYIMETNYMSMPPLWMTAALASFL